MPHTYCYCHGPEEGNMVRCDNSTCAYQLFHLDPLGLKLEPNHNPGIALIARKYSSFEKKTKKTYRS